MSQGQRARAHARGLRDESVTLARAAERIAESQATAETPKSPETLSASTMIAAAGLIAGAIHQLSSTVAISASGIIDTIDETGLAIERRLLGR